LSFFSLLLRAFIPYGNSFLFWFRLSQYKGWLSPFCRIMYARQSRFHHVQIAPSTKIGYGFYIGHGIDIVINPNTIIGNNVNISNFLNIGSNKDGTAAIIGNNVYIGPQVCIVGEIRIGNNSTIGAGAVIVKDVPENATVAGVPGKVLNYDSPGKYVNRRFPIE